MARSCGCSGQSCGCLVIAGSGIEVSGNGTKSNPFVVKNIASDLATSFSVNDTTTVDLVLAGAGSSVDPFILSANVIAKLQNLSDISNPSGNPVMGQSPIYIGTSGSDGHWEFRKAFAPSTTALRPSATTLGAGSTYYDTTLSKPAWSNGTVWKDATGTTI